MDFDRQLVVRIKAFLNAHDLTDSPTARELYDAYLEARNAAARRLLECEVLIQKKQKIEAMLVAQREPDLFETIDLLTFPGSEVLSVLADLYDWRPLDAINPDTLRDVRKAIDEMDDLRPLLTEFRRIARTDLVNDKLHLLREIYRLDQGNPEWRLPLTEVENQYLSRLIAEAQEAIKGQDFERLKEIHDELHGSTWLVTIPSIVMQKIDKLVAEHQLKQDRLRARDILERIGSAYSSFDTVALEDAILCWNEHCRARNYRPDEKELLQFNEANGYLSSEKKKAEEKRKFQQLLDRVTALIDEGAPLDEVEKNCAAAEATGMEIPSHIANRAAQYRLDLERERRTAAILKACRIIGTAAVVIAAAVGISLYTVRHFTEKRQASNLLAAVRSGDIRKARSLLRDIERKYPKLAVTPGISQARAELAKLEEEEKSRVEELQRLLAELDELLKPNQAAGAASTGDISRKLRSARELAKSGVEQQLVQERAAAAQELLGKLTEEDEFRFIAIVAEIEKLYKQALEEVESGRRSGNFDAANRTAERIVKLCREAKGLPSLKESMLAEYKEVLASGDNLQALIAEADKRQLDIISALRQISEAKNLHELEVAQRRLEDLAGSSAPELAETSGCMKRDAAALRKISDCQNNRLDDDDAAKSGYFADRRRLKEYRQSTAAAKAKLISAFDSLQKNTNGQRQIFIRFKHEDMYLDVYAAGKYAMVDQELSLTRVDDVQVRIVRERGFYYRVTIDGTEYRNCRLIYPKLSYTERLSPDVLGKSRAAHQQLIEKFFKLLPTTDDDNILDASIEFLQEIYASRDCSPYWKMQLYLRVLEAVAPLDLSTDGTLPALLKEIQNLKALDDGSSAPMYNKFLLEKIVLFFDNYDKGKLSMAAEADKILLKLRRDTVERSYRFLGTSFSVNGFSISAVVPEFRGKSGDVWCFDADGGGCLIVGYYRDASLVFNEKYRDFANGRVLFTTDAGTNMSEEFKKLKANNCGIDVYRIVWPEFWPLNMRGGERL
jgi:hypothetical protein